MPGQQHPIEVEIFGHTFALMSDKSEEDVKQIAAYVDQRMRRLAEQARTAVALRVAIMAAVTIADEYHSVIGDLGPLESL